MIKMAFKKEVEESRKTMNWAYDAQYLKCTII